MGPLSIVRNLHQQHRASFAMSFIQLESQIQPHCKDEQNRKRRSLTFAACLIGAALTCTLLVAGASHHPGLPLVAPRDTALQLRPDYPVSAYVYERGFFRWCIGTAIIAGAGAAFASYGPACVSAGPIAIGGCVLAAIASIGVVAALQNSHQQKTELKLLKQSMVYMEPVDRSTVKREVNSTEQFLSKYYGVADYRYEGRITEADEFNKLLVDRNEGKHVPVFSFTTPQGIRLHHAAVYNDTDGSVFHRFGFATQILPIQLLY
ncbi:hypothetical protein M433DRAFT_484712 [Acidomyces richmondensis BFW]|nr:MAG: hypothetical protein FE78DRAFT_198273 [Acidomyces sp. 'richmondensis']KYG41341.1 hypothetical protein M433DRAFT_484712 [Acidomyces richmondensis BFW]